MPDSLAEALAALEARVAAIEPGTPPSPLPGFGTIEGRCGRVAPRLDEISPSLLGNITFDFGVPFDHLVHRPQLTPGARRLLDTPNAGGSSMLSEVSPSRRSLDARGRR